MKSWSSSVVRINPLTLEVPCSRTAGANFVQKFLSFLIFTLALPRCKSTKVGRVSLLHRFSPERVLVSSR